MDTDVRSRNDGEESARDPSTLDRPSRGARHRWRDDRLLAPVVLLSGLLTRLGVHLLAGPQLTDDAYIFYRYVRSAAEGHGLVYNIGESVYGYTSPLYTLMLVPPAVTLGPNRLPTIAILFGLVCWIGLALVGVSLARRTMALPWIGGAVLALYFSGVLSALNGMETGLFLLSMFAATLLGVRGQLDWALVVSAVAALTRPEGVVFAVVVVMFVLAWHRRPFPWRGLLAGTTLLGAWLITATVSYGTPIPQSLLAKTGDSALVSIPGAARMLGMLTFGLSTSQFKQLPAAATVLVTLLALLVAALVVIDLVRSTRCRSLAAVLPMWFLLVWAGYVVAQPVNVWSWYSAPTSVVALWSVSRVVGEALTSRSMSRRPQRAVRLVLGATSCLALVAALAYSTQRRTENLRDVLDGLETAAISMVEATGNHPGTVMIGDIGLVGWRLERSRVFDLSGLVTVEGAETDERGELLSLGDLIERERPDALVLLDDPRGVPTVDTGSLERGTFSGAQRSAFERDYELVLRPSGEPYERERWVWVTRR